MAEFHRCSATGQGMHACHVCTGVGPADAVHCNRCGSDLHAGWSDSLQKTWAWLVTSVFLYLPANLLPIMHTRFLGQDTASTILGGVVTLWEHGSYPIAIVIFVASVLVPVGKIVILGWLCVSVQFGHTGGRRHRMLLYRVTEFVGRWSMVDVFVVGILVALIQLGNIMTILPGPAALAFAGVVVTSMLAAVSFDPRLLWLGDHDEGGAVSGKPATVKAGVNRVGKFHSIWLVPIVAFVIGVWMVYAHWASQGPLIEISFQSGEGIETGKTKVKRKNVEIGEVLGMQLSDNAESVRVSVRVHKENADLLREDSRFWVVRPRIGPGGVSGLGTLLSGAYIEMSPGTASETAREFEGLERPPATPQGTPGLRVTLDSDSNRALNIGTPVLFEGRPVGTIDYVHFNTVERRTYYDAFIEAPYDRLITTNTQFWFSSGVSVELSADGIRVDFANVQSIVEGGVSFGVPRGQPVGERITERAFFTIHPRESAINERPYEYSIQYVLLFHDSIRGLRPGAPVEYRGVKVGRVLRTDIDYDEHVELLEPNSRIPVTIEIVPAHLGYADTAGDTEMVARRLDELLDSGLHGTLEIGSLLTGQKYVELQYLDSPAVERERFAGLTVIPSISNQVGRLVESVAKAADALGKLPLDDVVQNLDKALEQTAETLEGLDEILDSEAAKQVFAKLNITLEGLQQLAADYSEGSNTNRELQESLRALERSLVELEPVLRQLRQKPNSLVFGGSSTPDPEPKGTDE